jgi:hypothetical protein
MNVKLLVNYLLLDVINYLFLILSIAVKRLLIFVISNLIHYLICQPGRPRCSAEVRVQLYLHSHSGPS